jgi:hypothetical protein
MTGTIAIPAASLRVTLQGRPIHTTITPLSRISEAGSTTHRIERGHNRLMDTTATILRNIRARYLALISLVYLANLIRSVSIPFNTSLAPMVAHGHPNETIACLGLGLRRGTDPTQTIDTSVATHVSAMSVENVASALSTMRLTCIANTATGIKVITAANGMRALCLSLMDRMVAVAAAAHASRGSDESQMAATTILTTCDLLA